MVARADDSLSCSGPGGGRRNDRVVQDENEAEEPNTILTDEDQQPNTVLVDSDAWPTAEGYTPLGDVFGMGSILVSMPPSSFDEDDDDDYNGGGEHTTYFSAGPNAFMADPSALFGNFHQNNDGDNDSPNDDQNFNTTVTMEANQEISDATDAFGEEDFRDVASSALMALEADYETVLRGEVRPSLMDLQPTSGPAMPLFSSSSIDPASEGSSNMNSDSDAAPVGDFADFASSNAAASMSKVTATIEDHVPEEATKTTTTTTTTATAESSTKKEVPNIDTVAVRKAVDGIISNTTLAEKLQQWQHEKEEKRQSKKQQEQQQYQHGIIPTAPLKAFARHTPKAVQATANLSRAATIAEALVRLSPPLMETCKEHLSIHVVGADHVECSSSERILQFFGPLARWLGSTSSSFCPTHLSLTLVGPNVPSGVASPVNLLESDETRESQSLQSAEINCHTATYHDWLAEQLKNNKESNESQHGEKVLPDLVVCYNAGIWGYNEWKPTIRYLVQLPVPINFVVTSYTIEEAEDDFDVIEQVIEEESKQSSADINKKNHTLWGPEVNPFASKKKRETVSALQGREYRENAAWQAWRLPAALAETTTDGAVWDEAAWDEICVNPHKEALERGQKEGREAGLLAGFRDGESVGVIKGVEFGMEIGFIRGSLQEILNAIALKELVFDDPSQYEKIEKTTSSLSQMLDSFPPPKEAFRNKNAATAAAQSIDVDSEVEANSDSPDIASRLQSIKSKFKLLTVQLKWNNFSLKNQMDEAAMDLGDNPKPESQTMDW